MIKEIKNDIIKKYKYNNYVIYIKKNNDINETYIQNEQYGIISLMFGVYKNINIETLELMIKNNIEEYIEDYKIKYED